MRVPNEHDGDATDGGRCTRRSPPARVVAFFALTPAIPGAPPLSARRRSVDAIARANGVEVEAYLIELPARDRNHGWGPACRDLLLLARAGALDAVCLHSVYDLASGRDEALLAAVELAGVGVRIVEAARPDGMPSGHVVPVPERCRRRAAAGLVL